MADSVCQIELDNFLGLSIYSKKIKAQSLQTIKVTFKENQNTATKKRWHNLRSKLPFKRWGLLFLVLLTWFWFALPKQLFNAPTSYIIEDKDGNLLNASIAADGQWRFGFTAGNARRVRFTVTINAGLRTPASAPPVYLSGLMVSYSSDAGLSRLGAGSSV